MKAVWFARRVLPFVLPAALLGIWEVAARSGLWSKLIFPSLVNIAYEFGRFLRHAGTAARGAGFRSTARSAASRSPRVVGIFVGMLMGRSKLVAGLLDPLFSGTYAVPKLALFPIFIFVFGIGSLSKVALVFLECLYPIVIMSYHGARSVNRVLLWSAQNMGASRAETLRRVVIPATAPFIFAGFRVARAGGDDRGGDHRDGELGRRPGLPRDLFAVLAADRPHARGRRRDRAPRLPARQSASCWLETG